MIYMGPLEYATPGRPSQRIHLEFFLQGTDVNTPFRYLLLAHQFLSSQHSISPYGEISIRANVSVESDGPSMVLGKLTVGMNPNKTVRDALLSLDMQASSSTLGKDTNICFAMNDDACDLALYVSQSVICCHYL
jgi:hypothetical protein